MNVHRILLSKIITKIWEGMIFFGEIFASHTTSHSNLDLLFCEILRLF
jgi:hypothetical protein